MWYFTDHADDVPAVRKLVHNEPLTSEDYAVLERIFEVELGTPEAYRAAYATKPFGLVVREIAKLDPQAAEQDNPNLEFRYCSKCEGNFEYCSDHLFSHTHVKR